MLTGQIGLVHGTSGFWAPIIRVVTSSRFNHAVVAVSETHCVSAQTGGAALRPITDYPDIVWSRFDLRPWQRRRIAQYARDHIGAAYNWLDFFAIGIAKVTRSSTPEWLRRHLASSKALQCAQMCDKALQAAGIHLFKDGRVDGSVYPGSLGRIFHERGWIDEE